MAKPITDRAAMEIADLTFRLLSGCQEKEERLAEQFQISVSEFRTLRMFRNESQLPIKTLVDRVGLSGSRLTRILASLEAKSILKRSIDPQDRRGILVSLTGEGKAIVGNLERRYVEMHKEILHGIPEDLHPSLIRSLERMLASLERWLKTS